MNIIEKFIEDWFALPAKTRYYLVNFVNFIVSITIYALMVTFLGYKHFRLCVFLQWFIPSFAVYLIQRYFVFKSKGDIVYEYLKYCGTWFFCFILNVAILEFFIMFVTSNVYSAQLFAYIIVLILSYYAYKYLAFLQNK